MQPEGIWGCGIQVGMFKDSVTEAAAQSLGLVLSASLNSHTNSEESAQDENGKPKKLLNQQKRISKPERLQLTWT